MSTGRLRADYSRVAGLATVEVVGELRKVMEEKEVQSLSQALGIALQEWLVLVRRQVVNPGVGGRVLGSGDHRSGVPNPVSQV